MAALVATAGLVATACAPAPSGGGGGAATNQAPTADLVAAPLSGAAPLDVDFDASGSTDVDGTITSYEWNFGDGATASGAVVDHTFGPGTWVVSLLVTDDDGATDLATTTVEVDNAVPVAAFTSSTTSGPAPLLVAFDAAGSSDADGTIVDYAWDFGDGATGTGLNANHTFASGNWTVTLTVTDDLGATDTATQLVTVGNPAPVAALSADPTSGPGPLTVSFDGSASSDANGPIASYAWDFGDGATATGPTASHTFAVGTWTVTLTVTDQDGATDQTTTTIVATNELPVAAFTRTPSSGTAPLAVSFNAGGSTDPDGSIVSYQWDFGDGGSASGVNPNHTFGVGTWTVTLTVTDNNGATDAVTSTVTVANALPTASFTRTPSSGNAPLPVAFDATASSDPNGTIVSYGWAFGDGATASGPVVNHTFGVGTFTVTLTVTDNDGGTATTTRTVTSNNVPPVAAFTVSPSSGSAPLAVTLNASGSTDSSGTIVSYSWDFDTAWAFPGDLASGQVVNRTYTPGVYTARLTVTDSYGASSSTTRTVTVSGTPATPTGLVKTGQGCCDTYGDFRWNPVPGADAYEISMEGYFLGGCTTDHGAVLSGQRDTGRVQAFGLCLGTNYDVYIRARANGVWSPWSGAYDITL